MGCCQASNEFTLSNFATLVSALGAIVTAYFLYRGFRKSNRTKAAEIYYNLELNFKEHIPVLLEIEYSKSYKSKIKTALKNVKNHCTTKRDDEIIIQLDRMFRHFNTCYQIKRLNIDNGNIDAAYWYYLDLFTNPKKKKLREYIRTYWKSVDKWLTAHQSKETTRKFFEFRLNF